MPTSDPNCPFCEIVRGNDPRTRDVYSDENVIGFFPLEPATLGHTLLVPRTHVPDIWALDGRTAEQLIHATLRVAAAVRRAMAPEGLNIIQSNGDAATQTVPHLHVHVVPRWHGDPLGNIWSATTNYSEAQKNLAWRRVRLECRRVADRDG